MHCCLQKQFTQSFPWPVLRVNTSRKYLLYLPTNYSLFWFVRKFGSIPLASQGWDHRRSNGDYFIINSHGPNPSLSTENENFDTFKFDNALVHALTEMGCTKPTHIQKLAIKPIMNAVFSWTLFISRSASCCLNKLIMQQKNSIPLFILTIFTIFLTRPNKE